MMLETWLFYPDTKHLPQKKPAEIVENLQIVGVSLMTLSKGVLAATGPAEYFTSENRLRLRLQVRDIHKYLEEQHK